jgi:hypothetical protein
MPTKRIIRRENHNFFFAELSFDYFGLEISLFHLHCTSARSLKDIVAAVLPFFPFLDCVLAFLPAHCRSFHLHCTSVRSLKYIHLEAAVPPFCSFLDCVLVFLPAHCRSYLFVPGLRNSLHYC